MLSWKTRFYRLYGLHRSNRYEIKLERNSSLTILVHSDGVVLVDPEYVKDRKVYASVLAGRDN